MPKLEEQISTLQERLERLQVRQKRVDIRRRAIESQREGKADLRRRILIGTLVLERVAAGDMDAAQLRSWLEQSLTRADDRALFELPPRHGA